MEYLKPPKSFAFEAGNMGEAWKSWKQAFEFFLVATETDAKSEKIKTSMLLTCIGEQGREIYRTFDFAEGDAMKLKAVLDKFSSYCNPRSNKTICQHKFFTRKQLEGESFSSFVTELKRLCIDCDFGELKDSLIVDMIIVGVRDTGLKERMLREASLSLTDAVKLGQSAEVAKKNLKVVAEGVGVNKINRTRSTDSRPEKDDGKTIRDCKFCGGNHLRGRCPAYGKFCRRCKKKNHLEKVCFSKVRSIDGPSENTRQSEESSSDDEFLIKSIQVEAGSHGLKYVTKTEAAEIVNGIESEEKNHQKASQWTISLPTNGRDVSYKLDTGEEVNVLPLAVYKSFQPPPQLRRSNIKLSAYNKSSIPVVGKCVSEISCNGRLSKVLFVVTETDTSPILGANACDRLDLVRRINEVEVNDEAFSKEIMNKYGHCFDELGVINCTYEIELNDDVKPVVVPTRKVPFGLMEKLKMELDRMESLDVISKVEKSTEWVNGMVIVEKPNGKLRICLDPRPLNKAIKRHHHPMPTVEEITAKMHNAKYFAKLDASSGYWQIKVDDNSSEILTFSTPYGRYKFNRMPFGIKSASEIFQREIEKIVGNVKGATNAQDDILIWGRSKEELKSRVRKVMEEIHTSGLRLNEDKCVFCAEEVKFLGHIFCADGVKTDPEKVKAIVDMKIPSSKEELQRFLGMVNYLGKFVPNLSDKTSVLRELLKKDVEFMFDKHHVAAVNQLKEVITSTPVLNFYDPTRPIRIRTDASQDGLGAMLEQKFGEEWHPVAFGSRSLTAAEKNYAQIEKETLSILYGCEYFHEYVYGIKFVVQNDHMPLKSIFNKAFSQCPPRIQRFLLRLFRYDFDFQYTPGKSLAVADTLSRASLVGDSDYPSEEVIHYVSTVINSIPISERKRSEIQAETECDPVVLKIIGYLSRGWPPKGEVDKEVASFYPYIAELSYSHGLLLRGGRIIVPKKLQSDMKKSIHQGHQGIVKCKSRAKQTVFWPNINNEIEMMVSQCKECLDYRNRLPAEELIDHEVPEEPWVKVAADVFTIYKKDYLLVVDYYSKYFEIASLNTPCDSEDIIQALKKIFSQYGIPKLLFTDNASQFISREFEKFSIDWDFDHDTSSPHYPKSNGLVERMVQTVKKTLKKAFKRNEDLYMAMLALKTTPLSDGVSPAAKLFGRNIRTNIPSAQESEVNERKGSDKVNLEENCPIETGTTVRIRTDKQSDWTEKGVVVEKTSKPRSYMVQNSKGNVVRRNRKHLLPTKEKFDVQIDDELDYLLHGSVSHPEQNFVDVPVVPAMNFDQSEATDVSMSEPLLNDEDQTLSEGRTTRSGREVRTPRYLSDYQLKSYRVSFYFLLPANLRIYRLASFLKL